MNLAQKIKIKAMKKELKKKRKEFASMPVAGERFFVPRDGADPVETILYRSKVKPTGPLPVFFNLHGGAWVGGDAALMDSFCALFAEEIPAFVVNVNYKKVDIHPFPYQQIELSDCVLYFSDRANEYGLDKNKFIIGGHSAGAHISAGAAIRLKELGFVLACQMLIYPFTDFSMSIINNNSSIKNDKKSSRDLKSALEILKAICFKDIGPDHRWISPMSAEKQSLQGVAPAIIVVCGKDILRPHGIGYAKRLEEVGTKVVLKEYPEAEHGFLEVNRSEYKEHEAISPKQEKLARECENFLIDELRKI